MVGDNEYQVLKLGDGLFQNSTTLNSATFGSGILEIGASAFKNCTNLVCVILNEELTTIGAEAFYGCTSFNSVIIYDAVTQIGENAFYNCSSLTVWCNENSYAYDYAIANNIPYEILNPEEIPQTFVLDGNTYYISNGTATLMSLTEADTVVIPSSVDGCPVTAITTGAISTSIYANDMSVYFPETLVNIPDDFTLRDRIIAYCTQGSTIQKYFEQNHIQYILVKNSETPKTVTKGDFTYYVYNTDVAALKTYSGTDEIVEVPATVDGVKITKILPHAFKNKSMIEIKLPDTIDYMYTYSFYSCPSLTTVNIPTGVSNIANNLFDSCCNIKNVDFHNGIKRIGSKVFGYENQVDTLNIPSGVEYIGEGAFRGTKFTETTYPIDAVVEDSAFANGYLEKLYIPNNTKQINRNAFLTDNNNGYGKVYPICYVYSNTYAHNFCVENNMMFYLVDGENKTEPYDYFDTFEVTNDDGSSITHSITYKVLSDRVVLTSADISASDYNSETGEWIYSYFLNYTVLDTVDGLPVTAINDYAFADCNSLTGITIPDTVTYIGCGAFSDCRNIIEVNLPSNLKEINNRVFCGTSNLKSITLPDTLEVIGESAFSGSGIEKIDFPSSLKKIDEWAFSSTNLKEFNYPNVDVGRYAFSGCDNLERVVIADGVTTIPWRIFQSCKNLIYVYIPTSVTDIDEYAFALCPKVILISDGSRETVAFKYAEKHGMLYEDKWWFENWDPTPKECTQDGITYFLTSTTLMTDVSSGPTATVIDCDDEVTGDITIPEKITFEGKTYTVYRIGVYAFHQSNITGITLPDTITVLGDASFQSSKLKSITLPEKLAYFGVNIFNMTQIEEFTFPTNYDLNFGVFASTQALKKVNIPEGVKVIPEFAFRECWNITELVFPSTLGLIKTDAIVGCPGLEQITIPGNVKIEERAIIGTKLKKVVIEEGVTEIPKGNFCDDKELELVYLPKSLTYIDYEAFVNCPKAIFCVYENSYAHEYCKKRCLPFYLINETPNPEIAYGASVSGTVSYTDGTVASGAEVQIAYSDGVLKETVTADQNGEYKFTYAEVGEYTITALDTNGNVSSSTVAVKRMNVFDVFVSGDTALTLKKGYSIEGSASESEAQITLTDTDGGFVADTKADQNGKFKIANVQNGEYVLKGETDNGTAVCEVTVFDADVSAITLNIKNQTSQTANITGFVEVDLRNHNHDRRHWIEVKLYNENGVAVGSTRSDYDGKYAFCNIPLGEYTIVAETYEMRPDHHHGYDRSYKLTGYAYLDIEKSGNYTADTIVLYEENSYRATISGTVMSYGNLKNCTVTLTDVFRNEVATVNLENGNGRYRFTNVRDGMYFVTAVTRNSGMGYTTVVVREGRVYGETNIAIYKSEKIDTHEKGFYNDVPECKNKTEAEKYRKRIAQEKSFYDGLSSKEKKQLSCDYIERLNKLCEWIADCNYTATDGVTVSGGGLVTSGDQLQNKNNISFNVTVEKTDSYTPNPDGVKTDNDYLYHCINDAAGENVVQQYYEITMSETVDGEEKQITSVCKDTDATGKVRITMPIPEEYRGYKNYSVVHIHCGEVTVLTDLDDDPNTVTFEIDKFSTFVLTATDETLAEEVYDSDLKFNGASISLTDNISINYKVKNSVVTESQFENLYAKFVMNGVEYTVKDYTESGEYYVFTFDNIAPNCINDVIYATLYGTKGGVEYLSEKVEYSVAKYCYNMLNSTVASESAEFRALLVDLLNFGTESQIYTSYNTENLANAQLTDTQKTYATAEMRELKSVLNVATKTIENPTVKWKGGSLYLAESVMIRLKIETESIENLTVLAECGDKTYVIKPDSFKSLGNNQYYVYFNGLNATQMSETVNFTVYNGETAVSNTLSYSIESYASAKLGGTDERLSDLVCAMMKYGDSARIYAESLKSSF